MSRAEELQYRARTVRRLYQYKDALTVPQVVVSTAATFVHRFYMRETFQEYHWEIVAAAAYFLASKVEENSRRLKDIAGAHQYLTRHEVVRHEPERQGRVRFDEKDPHFQDVMKKILWHEEALEHALCYDFTIRQPFWELVKGSRGIWKGSKATRVARVGWLFINDSLSTPLCLLIRPNVIAAAALLLACVQLEEELPPAPDALAATWDQMEDEMVEEGEEPEKPIYWLEIYGVTPDEIKVALEVMFFNGYNRSADDFVASEADRTFSEARAALATFPLPTLSSTYAPTTSTNTPLIITRAEPSDRMALTESPPPSSIAGESPMPSYGDELSVTNTATIAVGPIIPKLGERSTITPISKDNLEMEITKMKDIETEVKKEEEDTKPHVAASSTLLPPPPPPVPSLTGEDVKMGERDSKPDLPMLNTTLQLEDNSRSPIPTSAMDMSPS